MAEENNKKKKKRPRRGSVDPTMALAPGAFDTSKPGMVPDFIPRTGAVPPTYPRHIEQWMQNPVTQERHPGLSAPVIDRSGMDVSSQAFGPIDRNDPIAMAEAMRGPQGMGWAGALGGRMVQAGEAIGNVAQAGRRGLGAAAGGVRDWFDPTPERMQGRPEQERAARRAAQEATAAPPAPATTAPPPTTTAPEAPIEEPKLRSTREDKPKRRPRKGDKAPAAEAPAAEAPAAEAPAAEEERDYSNVFNVRDPNKGYQIPRAEMSQARRDRLNRIRKKQGKVSVEEMQDQNQQRRSEDEARGRARQLADREGRYTTTGKPSTSIKRVYQHEAPEQYRQAVADKRAKAAGMTPGRLEQQEAATDLTRAQAEAVRGGVGAPERLEGMRQTGETGRATIAADTSRAQMDSALQNAAMQVGSTEKMHLIDAQQKYGVAQQDYTLALARFKEDASLGRAQMTLANKQADNNSRIAAVGQMMSMMTSTPAEKLAFAAAAASGGLMGDEIIQILFSTEMSDPEMKQAAMLKIMELLGIEAPTQTGPANASDADAMNAILGLP